MQIQDVLDQLKIEYAEEGGHHHAREGWVQLRDCPFCDSHNYHLGFNIAARYFSCWKCGGHWGPKVLTALGMPPREAAALFPYINTGDRVVKAAIRQISLKEPPSRGPLGPRHRQYLLARQLYPADIVQTWGIEGIGLAARLAWRIYIPICYRGKRVSWTTRAIGERVAQRYISASAEEEVLPHKDLVYGLDYCRHAIVVVEGPFDVWRIGRGAGCLFGTAFTTAQVQKLAKIPHRFICFDNELVAQQRARALAAQLSCFPGQTMVLELDAKDPGSASEKELELVRKTAGL